MGVVLPTVTGVGVFLPAVSCVEVFLPIATGVGVFLPSITGVGVVLPCVTGVGLNRMKVSDLQSSHECSVMMAIVTTSHSGATLKCCWVEGSIGVTSLTPPPVILCLLFRKSMAFCSFTTLDPGGGNRLILPLYYAPM